MDLKQTSAHPLSATFLLLAGAISAGVHAGLAPEHLHEWPPLGVAFIAAAAGAAAFVAALALRPGSVWPPRLLSALFAALIAAYALTRLVALPPLDPEREAVDAVGVATCAIQAAGLVLALGLGRPGERARLSPAATTGGTA